MYNKIIRVITIVPIMAFAMLTIMYCLRPVLFGSIMQYVFAVLFLTVLPMLAYLLQPVIPKYKNAGREGQRNLAIVMAVIGYVLGIVVAICTDATKAVWIIYLICFQVWALLYLINLLSFVPADTLAVLPGQ